MDALPMDDEPPCADCTEAEDIDHLNQLANVAAGAARVAALKRRAESKAGRDVCWVMGCGCAEGLLGVPKAFLADASHLMLNEMLIDFGMSRGKARELPKYEAHNKLCAVHRPKLPLKPIIGARVMITSDGKLVPATVVGPAAVAVGRAGRGAREARAVAAPISTWRAESDTDSSVFEDLLTDKVWTYADLRSSYDASVARAAVELKHAKVQRINALEHQVRYHRDKLAAHKARGEKLPSPARPTPPPPPPPDAAQAAPSLVARVSVTTVVPRDWQLGHVGRAERCLSRSRGRAQSGRHAGPVPCNWRQWPP